jgi:hypothetical protein
MINSNIEFSKEAKMKKRFISSTSFSSAAGWLLLAIGLAVIGWTLVSSYNIFTGKTAAPEFFETAMEEVSLKKDAGEDIQAQMQQMIGEQLKAFLPADSITKFLNLGVWSMLAFILFAGAGKIAVLGIKLIKSKTTQ